MVWIKWVGVSCLFVLCFGVSVDGYYKEVGNTGVLGTHVALIPNSDKLLLWSRRHQDSTPVPPGIIGDDGNAEVSVIYDINTNKYEKKVMRTAPFCSGGSYAYDGSIMVAGGDEGFRQRGIKDGLRAIRVFKNGVWELKKAQLSFPRWYPTQVGMPDGFKTLILGGTSNGSAIVSMSSAEIYDMRTDTLYLAKRFLEHPLNKTETLDSEYMPVVKYLPLLPLHPYRKDTPNTHHKNYPLKIVL